MHLFTIPLTTLACAMFMTTHAHARPTALGTAFNYQGQLKLSGSPVNGTADFQFTLWDALSGGAQVAGPIAVNSITLANGQITAPIDFGSNVFDGSARWLQIAVRSPAGGGSFTTLTPRQPLTAMPYALQTRGIFADSTGSVGIGTTALIDPLTVAGPFGGAMTTVNGTVHTRIYSGSSGGYIGTSSGHALLLRTNDTDRISIDPLGNVGIGVFPNPNERLTVAGSMEIGTSAGDYQHMRIGGGNSSGFLYGSYAALGDGIHLGYNYYYDAAGVGHVINNGGATSRLSLGYGGIDFATGINPADAPTPVMHVGFPTYISTANFGIYASNPAYALQLGLGNAGKPGGGTWANTSDVRLKKNIEPLQGSLDNLLALRGVAFEYIDPKAINELPGRRIGMIAQEVEKVFPDWVEQRTDGYKSVTYRGFEALTVEALRELRIEKDAQIEQLRDRLSEKELQFTQQSQRIDAVASENALLRQRLDALEKTIRTSDQKEHEQ